MGRGLGRMDTCICMAESFHCSPEMITALWTGYTLTENAFGVKNIKIKFKNNINIEIIIFLFSFWWWQWSLSSSPPLLLRWGCIINLLLLSLSGVTLQLVTILSLFPKILFPNIAYQFSFPTISTT